MAIRHAGPRVEKGFLLRFCCTPEYSCGFLDRFPFRNSDTRIKLPGSRRITGLRGGRFRRSSLAVLDQSWAPLVISLMVKNKESHATARSGRTCDPIRRRVANTRGRRSGPLKPSRITMSQPPAFRPPPTRRRTSASSHKNHGEADSLGRRKSGTCGPRRRSFRG